MLRKHYGGFQRALRRELQLAEWRRPRRFESGERFLYLGRWYQLELREVDADDALPPLASAALRHGRLVVHVRGEWSPRTRARRIREQIGEFYGLQTGMHLLARVEGWARALRVKTPQLWMTRLGDAWAGCVPEQSLLVFDDRVIQAPLRVLDYVIVHELAHFYHRGHSAKFWSRVAKALPDHRERDDELRRLEPAMRW
jgi:predicted metal-dependent hydrolase